MNRPPHVNAPSRTGGQGLAARTHRRRRVAVVALVIAALAGGGYAAAGAANGTAPGNPGPGGTTSHPVASSHPPPAPVRLPVGTIGRYSVAVQPLTLVEPPRAGVTGGRVLRTVVRYPVIPPRAATAPPLAKGLFPLVVFAPGYKQCDGSYDSLLRTWASAGYVVAAVEFPITNCHVRGPESDLVNQPRDMAFAIRRLLLISGQPQGTLAGLVDPGAVAVAGHSDGGDTVAGLVANTCCLDHRVAAAMVLSGAEWAPLGGSYFPPGTPPILFVQGTADNVNPPSASRLMYQADTGGRRFYLNLYGASHLTPYEGTQPPEPIVARVTTEFLNRYVAGQLPAGPAMAAAGNVAGVAQLVRGGQPPS